MNINTILAIVHPEDRETVRQAIQEAMRSALDTAVEYRIQRLTEASAGSRPWPEASRSDSEPDRLMGVSTDITESKQVELRLQAESEYLKTRSKWKVVSPTSLVRALASRRFSANRAGLADRFHRAHHGRQVPVRNW